MLRHLLTGHEREVNSVAFSPNGALIASGCSDHTVRVWDAIIGTLQRTLTVQGGTARYAVFSPNSKYIAMARGLSDCTVQVWDATTGTAQYTLAGHDDTVRCVAFSPNGKRIASSSSDQTVRLWDAAPSRPQLSRSGHDGSVCSVVFSPDGKHIASGAKDSTVRVWDATTGTLRHTLIGHGDSVYSVLFSPDGRLIASRSSDRTVRVWNADTGKLQHTLTGQNGPVYSVAFTPDGQYIVLYCGTVIIVDTDSGNRCNDIDQSPVPLPLKNVEDTGLPRFGHAEHTGWISRCERNGDWSRVCWLPVELRGYAAAYSGQKVVIGARSGAVTILDFSRVMR
jgi:WD40 repeat protein